MGRCSHAVLSTGRGGTGVAFNKRATTWLVVLQGAKRWWLYPPRGPPTATAYDAVALCAASELPSAVANLRPEEKPLDIMCPEGKGLLVPAFWWHATIDE